MFFGGQIAKKATIWNIFDELWCKSLRFCCRGTFMLFRGGYYVIDFWQFHRKSTNGFERHAPRSAAAMQRGLSRAARGPGERGSRRVRPRRRAAANKNQQGSSFKSQVPGKLWRHISAQLSSSNALKIRKQLVARINNQTALWGEWFHCTGK